MFAVAWSPDGKMLASGSSDKSVKLWSTDKGHSNYCAVAQFFSPAMPEDVDLLEGVLYDRKNMLYEELLAY